MTNRMGWWDEDEPEFGVCHQCGCHHRLDLGCIITEERGRARCLAIVVATWLVALVVVPVLLWSLCR